MIGSVEDKSGNATTYGYDLQRSFLKGAVEKSSGGTTLDSYGRTISSITPIPTRSATEAKPPTSPTTKPA